MRQAANERTEIHDQFREYPLQRNWREVWYDEQLRSMVHYSSFVNNVADVIVWYDEQLRSMVHNSPFVNYVADVIVDVGKC